MTPEELEYLSTPDAGKIIEQSVNLDSRKVALLGYGAAIATQIKYLQRAKDKMTTFYNCRCIIPPLQYEQCSSEAVAKSRNYNGNICIDLTCGLGVDSYYFSKNFKKVISIEKDELLCKLATENFKRLKVSNIEIVNDSAVQFLHKNSNCKVDMIYVDPARRDENKKVFLLEDCSPNMLDIIELAKPITPLLVVKLSPLFDIDMIFNLFSKYGKVTASAISLNGECKEVVAKVEFAPHELEELKEVVICTQKEYRSYLYPRLNNLQKALAPNNPKYLYIPDVAFYKSRTVESLLQTTLKQNEYLFESENSAIWSNVNLENFEGSSYNVISIEPYKPKPLKRWFKENGRGVTILKREFPLTTSRIKAELNIIDGATHTTLFTTLKGEKVMVLLSKRAYNQNYQHSLLG